MVITLVPVFRVFGLLLVGQRKWALLPFVLLAFAIYGSVRWTVVTTKVPLGCWSVLIALESFFILRKIFSMLLRCGIFSNDSLQFLLILTASRVHAFLLGFTDKASGNVCCRLSCRVVDISFPAWGIPFRLVGGSQNCWPFTLFSFKWIIHTSGDFRLMQAL